MGLKTVTALLVFIMHVFSSAACAYSDFYGPFEKGGEPQTILQPCTLTAGDIENNAVYELKNGDDNIVIDMKKNTGNNLYGHSWDVSLSGPGICKNPLKFNVKKEFLDKVYTADLNEDGRPDFVIRFFCDCSWPDDPVFVAISGELGYTVWDTGTIAGGPNDFIKDPKDGKPVFIHCILAEDKLPEGSDGKQHEYFVYNKVSFTGGFMIVDNSGSTVFPEWIMRSDDENHFETKKLTIKQKRAWDMYGKVVKITKAADCK